MRQTHRKLASPNKYVMDTGSYLGTAEFKSIVLKSYDNVCD